MLFVSAIRTSRRAGAAVDAQVDPVAVRVAQDEVAAPGSSGARSTPSASNSAAAALPSSSEAPGSSGPTRVPSVARARGSVPLDLAQAVPGLRADDPVHVEPLVALEACTAAFVFGPKRPSISPGSNPRVVSIRCRPRTATPFEPSFSVGSLLSARSSFSHVTGPTMPSVRPAQLWNVLTALSV